MLSTPFCSHIIHYEPPRGFLVPKFSTYDGSNDPFDHIMHYRQLMTLDIGNDALLCKVFPASLQGQTLSWFHRLPPNLVDNFRDLSEAFVGQYLCFARHKQNISTLQNIKMQDNESLREFVKQFGQAVLQVEAYSMDAVLQIFKRSICPSTPFFESLAKKPPTTMDDLFRRASKYSMLEDDVRAATQSGAERSAKLPDRPRPSDRRHEGPSRPEMPPLTLFSISYEKLLPMIQDMSDFRWPRPLRTDPSKRDHSKKYAFHKEHGHTTEACRCLHYLVERLIKAGHLKQYLRLRCQRWRCFPKSQLRNPQGPSRPQSPCQLHPAWDSWGSPRPIDGTIIFPPVDPTRTLQPHRDTFILSLEIGDFDMRRILVDPGSLADLVQASASKTWANFVRIQRSVNYFLGRYCTADPSWPSHSQRTIFGGTRFITLQCYLGAHMTALHESHHFYISSNGKLPYQGWANRPIWQPVSRSSMLPDSTRGKNQSGG
uniref:Retrotransposon gag domain-containing protein n=1 Tax=Vitis vinifera TaxID=29760 RepID=A5BMG9_VITVI|nr:hypothetical protein VITISV_016834 [Vitis vinifera]